MKFLSAVSGRGPRDMQYNCLSVPQYTRHNSADSVPTPKLVCIREVAIRTTFSHMINVAGMIYYTYCIAFAKWDKISYCLINKDLC